MPHKVIITQIGRQIDVRTRLSSIVDKRTTRACADGNLANLRLHDIAMAQRLHIETLHHATHEIPALFECRQFAHNTKTCTFGICRLHDRNILQTQHLRHAPAHAIGCGVEIGMGRI